MMRFAAFVIVMLVCLAGCAERAAYSSYRETQPEPQIPAAGRPQDGEWLFALCSYCNIAGCTPQMDLEVTGECYRRLMFASSVPNRWADNCGPARPTNLVARLAFVEGARTLSNRDAMSTAEAFYRALAVSWACE